ncbi:MAG: hypothetical protein BGO49_24475 [Planctomycetales bacterium 71-10]|nr:MAG: hypothetical protein BGO49_24475 [Planctomycetales bacterium 71-10]
MAGVKRSNPKAFETLELRLKELARVETKIGWFPGAKYETGVPVAYAASLNEYGHGSTPPRPFFRPTIMQERTAWAGYAAQGAKAILRGDRTAFQVMDAIGGRAQEDVKETINQITSPPLSPITLELRAMKHKDPSLKVTGQTVGIAASRVNQPGYKLAAGTPTKPLFDTGLLITTLTHVTEAK